MQTQVNTLLQLPFNHLKVADLREILKTLGLKRSGNKESLIENLKLYLRKIGQSSDITRLTEVARLLDRYLPKKSSSITHSISSSSSSKSNKNVNAIVIEDSISKVIIEKIQQESKFKDINFVITPFIKPTHTLYCDVVPFGLSLKFSLNEEQSNLFHHKSNRYKILLYSASQISAEESLNKKVDCPIQYPCQPVLKVNDVEVTGMEDNLRKHNKSWSTKPVDITLYCKKKGNQSNMINEIRFLSTFISSKWKDFVVKIIICEYLTLQEAVSNIKKNFISKEDLLRQRLALKKANDDEIETTSSIVSLRCPISRARIKTPCRFKECTHVQCFDVTSYLQLNEKSPNWKCPVCNTRCDWKSLVIDGYMQDILNNVSCDIDSVTVEVNGTWHIEEQHPPSDKELHYESEEDEEENRYFAKLEAEIKAKDNDRVIDLTLSDDENKNTKAVSPASNTIPIISSALTPKIEYPTTTTITSSSSSTSSLNISQLNSQPNRKRTMADLIAPRKRANGRSASLRFENAKSSSNSTSSSLTNITNELQRSNSSSSYFNPIVDTSDLGDSLSLNYLNSLINTNTSNDNMDLLTSSLISPLSSQPDRVLAEKTPSSTAMNIDSTSSLNEVITISDNDSSNRLISKNINSLASKSLNIPANTNNILESLSLNDTSLNSLNPLASLPLESLNLSSLNDTTSSGITTPSNTTSNSQSNNTLNILSSSLLSGDLDLGQNSLTIPTSIPSTTTKSSSITIPMNSNTSTSSALNLNSLLYNPLTIGKENPYNSLLKSTLLSQTSKAASSSPSINKASLKLKSHSLTNSPRMSPKPSNSSLSAQSSPNLGRSPNKFKNISPKPPKPNPTSFDLNSYYNLLSSMNYSNSINTSTPSSLNLTNPSLSLTNNLLLNNSTDPSTLLYLNSLTNNSLLSSNLSQLATPPAIPNYFNSSLLTSLQTNPYNSTLLGNDYSMSMTSALAAASVNANTNTSTNTNTISKLNSTKSSLSTTLNSLTSTKANTSTNIASSTLSTSKALEKLLKEAASNLNTSATTANTTSKTSALASTTSNTNANTNLTSALLNASLLSSSSASNASAAALLSSLNSNTTSAANISAAAALLNSFNSSTVSSATTNTSAAVLLNSLNPNTASTTDVSTAALLNSLNVSANANTNATSTAAGISIPTSFDETSNSSSSVTSALASASSGANLASLGAYQGLSMNSLIGLNYTNPGLYSLMLANNNLSTTNSSLNLLNPLVSNSNLTSNTNSGSSNNNSK